MKSVAFVRPRELCSYLRTVLSGTTRWSPTGLNSLSQRAPAQKDLGCRSILSLNLSLSLSLSLTRSLPILCILTSLPVYERSSGGSSLEFKRLCSPLAIEEHCVHFVWPVAEKLTLRLRSNVVHV